VGAKPAGASPDLADFPRQFSVDVDGEVFRVKVSPIWDGGGGTVAVGRAQEPPASQELPEGAILCGRPGLVLSIQVKVGDCVAQGDEVAIIETMKMRGYIVSPRQGVVKEIRAQEGQMVVAGDVLLVVA
jgi:pyruvate carboxylase subunit B